MDTLTEILNSIFVANSTKKKDVDHLTVRYKTPKVVEETVPVVEETVPVPVVEETVQEPVVEETVQEPVVEDLVPVVEEKVPVQVQVVIDISERNVLIVNSSFDENMNTLVDLLSNLESSLFKNELNIVTSSDNKPLFKKMLIENPELYFTNLKFNCHAESTLTSNNVFVKGSGIFIIDFDHLSEIENILPFFSSDKYLIVLSTEYSSYIAGLYNTINDFKSTVLINTKDRTKSLQKKFYTKIVKNTIVSDTDPVFDDYLDQIKNSDKVVVKSGQVQLN